MFEWKVVEVDSAGLEAALNELTNKGGYEIEKVERSLEYPKEWLIIAIKATTPEVERLDDVVERLLEETDPLEETVDETVS